MSKARGPLLIGLTAAAGGLGYYLYQSGGNVKVAEKQFQSDVATASSKVKSEIPGKAKEAKKDAEKFGAEVGAKFDSTVAKTNADIAKAKADAEAWGKETKAGALKKIDEADRKIEDKAAKAKSGISGWFGGK